MPVAELLADITTRGESLARATDRELRDRAETLRRQAREGEELDVLLPECFALVREAAHRTLEERPYDVQMIAGMALHRGRLVEMQTGEGKTLAAVAPTALNALAGRGVHVLTYNDYLARRDAVWMRPIYERLGLTVAFVQEGLSTARRSGSGPTAATSPISPSRRPASTTCATASASTAAGRSTGRSISPWWTRRTRC
jgi:preprotein translocase subunit SecA